MNGPPPDRAAAVSNEPGQPSLSYRIATHAAFLDRMLRQLSRQAIPDGSNEGARPLAALTTRSTDDPAVAMLDAWAVAADVLTFYQERVANEGFLRTATERRSVLELARAIGYELGPGVAASTYLAFTVESAPGSPGRAVVPKGTRVQSIPPQGKLPQTFETSQDVSTRAEWNELHPRRTRTQVLSVGGGTLLDRGVEGDPVAVDRLYLAGTDTNLKPGDVLLAALPPDDVGQDGQAGSDGQVGTVVLSVMAVEPDDAAALTVVRVRGLAEATGGPPFVIELPPRPLFGGVRAVSASPFGGPSLSFSGEAVQSRILAQPLREIDLQAIISMNSWNEKDLADLVASRTAQPAGPDDEGVFAFRARAGFFGNNAPRWATLPKPGDTRGGGEDPSEDPFAGSWDGSAQPTVWTDSQGNPHDPDSKVYLERTVPEVVADSWAVLLSPAAGAGAYRVAGTGEAALADFALSGRSTSLNLAEPGGGALPSVALRPSFRVRQTTAFVQSQRLDLAPMPVKEPVPAGATSLTLDEMVLGLQPGQPVALAGERSDAPGVTAREVVLLHEIVHAGGFTTLHFATGLTFGYVRAGLTINANVAPATHGEAVTEVLGGGDATKDHQAFTLKRPPLTYVSAPTPSGVESTLSVRVNRIEWAEAPSLYGVGPKDQRFVVRTGDDGATTVTFGDGTSGARLPTGQDNVVATYRTGIGPDGEVESGSISLLQTKPLGIKSVTNPVPSTGAAAPEQLDEARSNAPRAVLTLDRVVSLRDYEDFARSFAGIAKAQARVLWSGERRVVHLTVAGTGGEAVDPTSDLYRNLVRALSSSGDPAQQVAVMSYQPVLFAVSAHVLVDPRYLAAEVLEQVEAALQDAFAFDRRSFGQSVTAAEVTTVIQGMTGVVATTLYQLAPLTDPTGPGQVAPASFVTAAAARFESGSMQPAQLLRLAPGGVSLSEMRS